MRSAQPAKPFVTSRTVNAPIDVVFAAWTQADHLKNWFGPAGFKMLAVTVDLRPGGVFHYGMQAPNGAQMWGKWVFLEIHKPDRLVFVSSFSDAAGGVTRHPMSATWPLETLSTVSLVEQDGKTTVRIQGEPVNASEEEIATFVAAHSGMTQGWAGTFAQFEAYLASL